MESSSAKRPTPCPPSKQQANSTVTVLRRTVAVTLSVFLLFVFRGVHLTDLFPYHPLTMVLAGIAVLPEVLHASLSLRRSRSMPDRSANTVSHSLLALALQTLALTGFAVIYVNKAMRQKRHFVTYHGLVGMLTCSLLVLQIALGLFLFLGLVKSSWLGWFRKAHRWVGWGVAAGFVLSMLLGIGASHFSQSTIIEPVFRWAAAIACGALVASVLWFE